MRRRCLLLPGTCHVQTVMELGTQEQTEPQYGSVFDLGQNMVGYARCRFRAPAGTWRIQIRYGEMLKDDGTLYTENLRTADATDEYVCRGTGEEIYQPYFTFHGFRVGTGVVELPHPDDVVGVVLHTPMQQTGTFTCSNALVNRLKEYCDGDNAVISSKRQRIARSVTNDLAGLVTRRFSAVRRHLTLIQRLSLISGVLIWWMVNARTGLFHM